MMNKRIKQFRASFAQNKIHAFLITNDINIEYLTGFPASESWCLIGSRTACYITDFRYIHEARQGLKGIRVKRYIKSIYETAFTLIKEMRAKRVGIDTRHLTMSQYQMLESACPKGVRLVKADGLVEKLREVKDNGEIRKIKKALKVHKQAHQFLKR